MPHFEHLCAIGRLFFGFLFEVVAAALFRIAFVSSFSQPFVCCATVHGAEAVCGEGDKKQGMLLSHVLM